VSGPFQHRMSLSQFAEGRKRKGKGKGKGKGCSVTSQASREGDRSIVLTTLKPALKGVGGQHHAPTRFTPRKETW